MARGLHELDRRFAALRQRYGGTRRRMPDSLVRFLAAGRDGFKAARTAFTTVEHRSPYVNLFHCCVHKTGSQWLGAMLSDLMTYRHCGLPLHHYQAARPGRSDGRPITERSFPDGFPERTIVSPLYIDHAGFAAIPKPGPHRAFFVMRDPRDILVSWYLSILHSHVPIGEVPRVREELAKLPHDEGLMAALDFLDGFGLFSALRSWARHGPADETVLLVRYEDAVGAEGFALFRRLYDHLGIPVPDDLLRELIEAYSFRRLTGRAPGETDERAHLRSGRPGDWRTHLGPRLIERFEAVTGGLAAELGYPAADASLAEDGSCG